MIGALFNTSLHSLIPIRLYLPATHAVQTWDEFAAATLLYAPAPQAKHAVDVAAFARLLYVPILQAVHPVKVVAWVVVE